MIFYSFYLVVLISCFLFFGIILEKFFENLFVYYRNFKGVFMKDGLRRLLVVSIVVNKLFWSDGYGMDYLSLSDMGIVWMFKYNEFYWLWGKRCFGW